MMQEPDLKDDTTNAEQRLRLLYAVVPFDVIEIGFDELGDDRKHLIGGLIHGASAEELGKIVQNAVPLERFAYCAGIEWLWEKHHELAQEAAAEMSA